MENNRYAMFKHDIHRISQEENVDIGTACAMLRDRMGWHFEDGKDKEITEFCQYVSGMEPDERAEYFGA